MAGSTIGTLVESKATRGGYRPGSGAKPGNSNSLKNGRYSTRVQGVLLAMENTPGTLARAITYLTPVALEAFNDSNA